MKTTCFKISFVILLISSIFAGCKKEEVILMEISPESINTVIDKEINGVAFKFCLLTDAGEPTTIFNEGENFTLQFSIQNKTKESLPFYDYGYYITTDFFAVKSAKADFGKPFKFIDFSSTKELRWILPEGYSNFIIPWKNEKNEFQAMHGLFEGLKQPYLVKGKYYTQFTYNFTFGDPNKKPDIETGLLTFRINFEIK